MRSGGTLGQRKGQLSMPFRCRSKLSDPICRDGGGWVRDRSKKGAGKNLAFNVKSFLDSAGVSRKIKEFHKAEKRFSQSDPATTVIYIQEGGVKLSVVNKAGKEALVAILGAGDFFGGGCLAGQSVRMMTATTATPVTALFIQKEELVTRCYPL
jgi:CRP-like cAMP-binding protein